jgi:hypothetical protein
MKTFLFLFSFIFAINLNAQVIDILPIQKKYNNPIDTLHLSIKCNELKNIEISTIDCMPNIFRQDSALIYIGIFERKSNKIVYTDNHVITTDCSITMNNNLNTLLFSKYCYLPGQYIINTWVMDKFYQDYGKRIVLLTVLDNK